MALVTFKRGEKINHSWLTIVSPNTVGKLSMSSKQGVMHQVGSTCSEKVIQY